MLLTPSSVEQLAAPVAADSDDDARRINNEIGVVEGEIVRSQVLTALGLESAPEAQAFGDPDSDIITVRVDSSTPELAARLANAYVAAYISVQTTQNTQLAAAAIVRLQGWTDDLQTQLDIIDSQIAVASTQTLVDERTALAAEQAGVLFNLERLRTDVALGIAPAEVVDIAAEPDGPYAPDRVNVLIAALAAGLALGLLAAIAIDRIDRTLHTVADVRRAGAGPVLAVVPVDPSASSPPLALHRSSDPAATAYRVLRNQLTAVHPTARVIAVSGVRPGDGATTTAANLAVAFAEHGRTVAVVDLDLRSPSLHRLFGVDGSLGVIDILGGESIELTALPLDDRLTVFAAGPVPPDPTVVLSSTAIATFFSNLREKFDVIVVDSSPLSVTNDALLAVGLSDVAVAVCRLDTLSAVELSLSVENIAAAHGTCAGVVVNSTSSRQTIS